MKTEYTKLSKGILPVVWPAVVTLFLIALSWIFFTDCAILELWGVMILLPLTIVGIAGILLLPQNQADQAVPE
ncbi:MAG: hypothetical protein J6O55_07895 [Lachnospiraceae bacterium]|nr:hypothetical protein [Lachnospiraceae bacterium]